MYGTIRIEEKEIIEHWEKRSEETTLLKFDKVMAVLCGLYGSQNEYTYNVI